MSHRFVRLKNDEIRSEIEAMDAEVRSLEADALRLSGLIAKMRQEVDDLSRQPVRRPGIQGMLSVLLLAVAAAWAIYDESPPPPSVLRYPSDAIPGIRDLSAVEPLDAIETMRQWIPEDATIAALSVAGLSREGTIDLLDQRSGFIVAVFLLPGDAPQARVRLSHDAGLEVVLNEGEFDPTYAELDRAGLELAFREAMELAAGSSASLFEVACRGTACRVRGLGPKDASFQATVDLPQSP